MGLDISAYSDLKPVVDRDGADCYLYCAVDYQFGDLEEGSYEGTECPHSFRRSYSGWSRIRERLAELAGWPEWDGVIPKSDDALHDAHDQMFYKRYTRQAHARFSDDVKQWDDLPLLPLIRFSDCEGAICSDVCKKISADLDALPLDEDLKPLAEMFRWASENNGVVVFH